MCNGHFSFLHRVVDDDILVTFDDGRSALKALHLDGKQVLDRLPFGAILGSLSQSLQ